MVKMVIAVDGPAGAGKSTIAKIVANKLNLEYIDSGAIYRAITKKILDSKLKIDDYKEVEKLLKTIELKLDKGNVFVNNVDMTAFLRTREITENVSPVSSNISIRKKVNAFLNKYSQDRSVIMDGRDIGTVVFPGADFKFYLDASVEVRATRRFKEGNYNATIGEIAKNITARDENDKNKEYGALKIADDAVYIDTSELTIDEVVNKIINNVDRSGNL